MKIFYSPEYSGAVYVGIPEGRVMMDTTVVNTQRLLALVEFLLGLHYDDMPAHKRTALYYGAMRRYIDENPDSIFASSFAISGLGTAKAVLSWRDSLSMAQWDFSGSRLSRRLRAIIGIERYFSEHTAADLPRRIIAAVGLLGRSGAICSGWEIESPVALSLLRPIDAVLVKAVIGAGASFSVIEPSVPEGPNLARVREALTSTGASGLKLDPADDSFQIWRFPDEHSACRYLAAKGDGLADVWVDPWNKEMDNWRSLFRRPLGGSGMGECAPQLTQLFVLGLSLFDSPLNIYSLIEWLNLPLHPLDNFFRRHLASTIAEEGGYRNDRCHKVVEDYIDGAFVLLDPEQQLLPEEEQLTLRRKDRRTRIKKVSMFLPAFTPEKDDVDVARLREFAENLASWCRQRFLLLQNANENVLYCEQLAKVAEMCDGLGMLLESHPAGVITHRLLDSWVSTIYRERNFTHAVPEAGGDVVVDSPAKIITDAGCVAWLGFEGDEARKLDCAFLYPSERESLEKEGHICLWKPEDERNYHQLGLLTPVARARKKLILVVCDRRGGEPTEKHPLMIHLEQCFDNLNTAVRTPDFDISELNEIPLVTKDAVPTELQFDHADKLVWPGHTSPTVVSTLVEHPFDFMMERLLGITYDEKASIADIKRTEGNIAHAVIERLFAPDGDACDGTWQCIAGRIDEMYDDVFDAAVEAKGAILQLSEYRIEARYLHEKLLKNLKVLLEIIRDNNLRVTGCEHFVEGYMWLGLPEEYDKEGQLTDRDMLGFIDMTLEDAEGHPVIIDFKWTTSRDYYQDLLAQNRSVQLELYRYLLGKAEEKNVERVAYFLMPRARLFSKEHFAGRHCERIAPANTDDIVKQLRNAAIYRIAQIKSGIVETNGDFSSLQYVKDTLEKGLFPLMEKDGLKEGNRFSAYRLFINVIGEQ